jgi:hypothetical protein
MDHYLADMDNPVNLVNRLLSGIISLRPPGNIFDPGAGRGQMDAVTFAFQGYVKESIPWLCAVDPSGFRFSICDLLSFNGPGGVNY